MTRDNRSKGLSDLILSSYIEEIREENDKEESGVGEMKETCLIRRLRICL